MIARFAPIQPASLPQNSAPKNATNWMMRITAIRVSSGRSSPPLNRGAAANVDATAIMVCMPSLYIKYEARNFDVSGVVRALLRRKRTNRMTGPNSGTNTGKTANSGSNCPLLINCVI